MEPLQFGTKAETLELVRKNLRSASVKESKIFTLSEWKRDPDTIISKIQHSFDDDLLIVRSSAKGEDSAFESHAGAYTSVPQVDCGDASSIREAIETVIASYGNAREDDQFFVQAMVSDLAMNGVLFTRVSDTFAPYYVINYDSTPGSFDAVTSGTGTETETIYRYRGHAEPIKEPYFQALLGTAKDLEVLFECDHLDIEFAITSEDELFILQVRPIPIIGKSLPTSDDQIGNYLFKIYSKLKKLNAPHRGLHGKKAIYSVMTDWNPAEIIGIKPHALALSLYKELVTDNIWAYQRKKYGYQDLRSFPLVISLLGCPYVDVRASLNSFVPTDLDPELAGKLVDYYISELAKNPTQHDKVEFNVIFSCYYLNISEKLKGLSESGFSELEIDRIKFALLNLTNKIIHPTQGNYQEDLSKIEELEKRFQETLNSDLHIIDKIYWLVEDCKRYGTLPFAGLARAGFIATQFLHSFVELGIFTEAQSHQWMNSLNTVAREMANDFAELTQGEISREEFLHRYGHLRPGTYDILSERYDRAFEKYFDSSAEIPCRESEPFRLTPDQMSSLDTLLIKNGIVATGEEILHFMKIAIEGREYAKFIFTKNISQILTFIEELGERFQISREELSHLNIRTLLDLYANLSHFDVDTTMLADIERNRDAYSITESIELPQLITDQEDVYEFRIGQSEPNFVTSKRITSVTVTEEDLAHTDLSGKIVIIKSADPGYDWLFSRDIGGLITLYGGANSHMAVRCAEMNIPAVIGCGEQRYSLWNGATQLDMDCGSRSVRIVH